MARGRSAVALFACLIAASAIAEDGLWSVIGGVDFSSGTYGLSRRTDTWYMPLAFKYEADRWAVRLTIPYIETSGPAGVVGRGIDRLTLASGSHKGAGKASGLGDIIVAGTWTAFQRDGLLLDLGAKVKLATGDENAGLGTGENDFSLQVDAFQTFGTHTVFGTLGVRKMGDPAGVDLRDPFYATLGWSHKMNEVVAGGVSYDYRQRLLSNGAPISESTAFLSWKLDATWKLQTYAIVGFSRASPDWGGGLMLHYSH